MLHSDASFFTPLLCACSVGMCQRELVVGVHVDLRDFNLRDESGSFMCMDVFASRPASQKEKGRRYRTGRIGGFGARIKVWVVSVTVT